MKLKVVAAISALAISALPHAQSGLPLNVPKPTIQIITSDKVKTQAEQSAGVGCEAVEGKCSLMVGQPV